ncbi:aspartate/glutamate racemase family protein [Microbacterium sp. UBA837]|jgi:maleate isomerase|uniref:maleate cis-trans isomerase family protein n=1 Tax=Actinomycetes TaxID=1760 RepID=UPI0026009E54|nr:aspartate/glutamate racemase family protein [Microbacterium sp. UBA837]|tara:strand:- start:2634 stop:3383 length:750 start_codon:yes stop_codon:yes gene_type:complete
MTSHRVGLIVPSSNTTMETEIPAILRAHERVRPDTFTFHSARIRMRQVTQEELTAMDQNAGVAAAALADARVDVMAYACLVATMSQGLGHHRASEERLGAIAAEETGARVPVVASAGALVQALDYLGAKKVAVIAPYMKPLTATVCGYIEHEGVEVVDSISLEVPDNLEVGRLDPQQLIELARKVDTSGADALVLSACVQMPSLPVLQAVQDQFDIPVISAAAATAWRILAELGLDPVAPGAGNLLKGA